LTKLIFDIKGEFQRGERLYRVHHRQFLDTMKRDSRLLGQFLAQGLQAISVLERHEIIHSDLKPDNILVDWDIYGDQAQCRVRICDFGSASSFEGQDKASLATPEYMPPEALLACPARVMGISSSRMAGGMRRGSSAAQLQSRSKQLRSRAQRWSFDIWSIGAILLELSHGAPLWLSYKCRVLDLLSGRDLTLNGLFAVNGRDPDKILHRQQEITREDGLLKALKDCAGIRLDQDGMDLLAGMLEWDPQVRISPDEALGHRFFAR